LVVASRYMKGELVNNGFKADHISVHAPVPRQNGGTVESSFDSRNLVVFSGQIIRGKGVDVLLESLAKITTHFEAVIIGDGSHRPYCERLSKRLGLSHRVHFTGFVPQAELKIYHRNASVAVISSVWPEPFGAVGLEAMRCGLPVVGFKSGGVGEWLIDGETGYLVPWMDRQQYAGRIEALLRNKKLARTLGENGRELAERRFSFSSYIRDLEGLLARTAQARPDLIASN
jgi:glycosyltransferase involved in cell wall biosynthesis